MKRVREEEEEREEREINMAKCLMLLSRGSDAVVGHDPMAMTQSSGRVFACKTCNREFPSFQALGGHRASHKRPRMAEDQNRPGGAQTKPRSHECSICGLEFAIGQALGGHMRRHRSTMEGFPEPAPVVKKLNSSKVLFLDLNFPPAENDGDFLRGGFLSVVH